MSDCHHQTVAAVANLDFSSLLWLLFVTGMAGSFTHCIAMCGPIAMAQLNIRLMKLSPAQITEKERIKAAVLLPYYIGKAVTYSVLTLLAYGVATNIAQIPYVHYIASLILGLTAVFFLSLALNKSGSFLSFFENAVTRKFQFLISHQTKKLHFEPYGFKGFVLGMILGLIPCGLVYGSIVLAIDSAQHWSHAMAAMFVFGIATVPGLFLSAYAGTIVFKTYRRLFKFFYVLTMLFNSGLLFFYAYKQIKYAILP